MGNNLLRNVVSSTGLPENPVQKELETLMNKNGYSEESLTLEELRLLMEEYLHIVFAELASNEKSA